MVVKAGVSGWCNCQQHVLSQALAGACRKHFCLVN